MTDPAHHEDEAALYVLGQLNDAERRAFEARLAGSPELQTAVWELQSGAEALAVAVPQFEAPPQVWNRVAETLRAERAPANLLTVSFLPAWLRSGWAVAAAFVLGWCGHVFLVTGRPRSGDAGVESPVVRTEVPVPAVLPARTGSVSTPAPSLVRGGNRTPPESLAIPASSEATAVMPAHAGADSDDGVLRRQLERLQAQVMELQTTLTQQFVLPPGFNRLHFFTLSPAGAGPGTPEINPEALHALSLALAQELSLRTRNQDKVPAQTNPDAKAGDPELKNQLAKSDPVDDAGSADEPAGADDLQPADTGSPTVVASVSPPAGSLGDISITVTPNSTSPHVTNIYASVPAAGAGPGADTASPGALGFISPESGRGALALTLPLGNIENPVAQIWGTGPDGNPRSLGSTPLNLPTVVLHFDAPPDLTQASIFVTLEPRVSTVPTGPVVAVPFRGP